MIEDVCWAGEVLLLLGLGTVRCLGGRDVGSLGIGCMEMSEGVEAAGSISGWTGLVAQASRDTTGYNAYGGLHEHDCVVQWEREGRES